METGRHINKTRGREGRDITRRGGADGENRNVGEQLNLAAVSLVGKVFLTLLIETTATHSRHSVTRSLGHALQ